MSTHSSDPCPADGSTPETPTPRVALIIPHYNDTDRLVTCLTALLPQKHPDVELVVVDNGSTQDLTPAQDLLAQYGPEARLVVEDGKGAALARNRGVAETRAPHLLFLDADCVPDADWLKTACALAGADQVIGGRIDVFDETPPPRSGAEAFETVFAFHQQTYIAQNGFSVTANLLTTRAVFSRTGPFINALSEDLDWCHRAVATGAPLTYEQDLRVLHPTRQDWPALRKKWVRITKESFATYGTTPRARLGWAIRAVTVLGSGVVFIPKVLRHEALSGVEKGRAVGTLLRLRSLRAYWMLGQAIRGAV
ncbi:glycosyltransferase family 2 protein [Dinoroseobacter sp. S76]|uniref:glycosyltransferase family 2 protein n=1 Tax=Dinoroseobacter sp. S76 TaxID=3415124 RepID=UPI003C79CAF5